MALGASLFGAGCAPTSPMDKAVELTRNHQEDDAIQLLRAYLEKHPEDLKARRLLIRIYAETGDLPEAKLQIDDLSRRMPENDPTPDIELGHAYELAHKFEEALAAYDEAAKIAPNSPAGPHEGGMRAAHWGEAEAAEPRLAEAVRRGQKDPETFHALGLVRVHTGDLDGAEEAYRAGLAADPEAIENWLGLATVAVVRGDGALALQSYDALLAKRPNYAAASLGRAWALAKLGRKDDAKKELDHALALGAPKKNVDRQRAALDAPAAAPSDPAIANPPDLPPEMRSEPLDQNSE
jgi:tetratricopeptide (TPR) repeat protein